MPDDRPSSDVINNDKEFDKWLEAYERKMAKETAQMHKVKQSPTLNR